MGDRSYTPSPPRGYSRKSRSPSPGAAMVVVDETFRLAFLFETCDMIENVQRAGREEPLPSKVMVDDLRRSFGQFGLMKDIYLPKDFHTGELRGFGFVQYVDPADAAEAKYHMHGQILHDRELTVVFAEENRKKPADMRAREGGGRSRFHDRRSPCCTGSWSRNPDYSSLTRKQRDNSGSFSPQYRRDSQERWYPRRGREASYSRSPPLNGSRSQSPSPVRGRSPSLTRSRSPARSQSSNHEEYERDPRDRNPSRLAAIRKKFHPEQKEKMKPIGEISCYDCFLIRICYSLTSTLDLNQITLFFFYFVHHFLSLCFSGYIHQFVLEIEIMVE